MAEYHPQEDVPMADVDVVRKVKLQKEEKGTLEEQQQHHRSSSSSDDEEEDGEKRKKKGLKEKVKEKISHRDEEPNGRQDESVPAEKCNEMAKEESTNQGEKKGLLKKLKEKLPGLASHATPTLCAPDKHSPDKKGILEKIKEKLPGSHKNEEKDKEI